MDRLTATNRLTATDRLTATNRLNDGGRMIVEYPPASELYAPLTHSIIPQRSMGAVTYSRASIASVTDFEGVIRNVLSGEARFQGARRVQNISPYSQAIDNAAWIKSASSISGTKVAYADGTLIGQTIVEDSTNSQHTIAQSINYVTGNNYILSFSAKSAGRTFIQMLVSASVTSSYQNFDLTNGTCSGTASVGTITAEGDGWYRCSMSFTSVGTTAALTYALLANSLADARFQAYLGGGLSGVSVTRIQVQNVTGQSVQTPAEYVSTNVLNSTPYHGANVDGVKYFDTDLSGNQLSPDGYLAEGGRTNLFTDSEDFSLWTKAGTGVITPNATIAPDGRMTADLLTLSTTNEGQSVNKTITTTASIYGYSVYVKPNGNNYVQLLASAGINSGYCNFDLLNGVVGTSISYTGRIEALPNGWYRLKITTPTVTAATGVFIIAAVPSASASRGGYVTGTGTSGVYLWGAQLELGPSVSTYIPTTTTTVTRNTDVLTYEARNAIANQGAFSAVFSMNDDLVFDRRALNLSGGNNNRLQFQVRMAGIPYTNVFFGTGTLVRSVTSTQEVGANNIAVAWTNGVSVNMYMNNTKYSSVDIPDLILSSIDVGGGANFYPIFGCVKDLRIWKTRPTDAELLLLSNNP